jgi:excisionase family DNA binding protein
MPQLLTFDEAKEFLRITSSTLYRLVQNGVVPASKVGGQWRFKQDRLEGWLSEQEARVKQKNTTAVRVSNRG